ncbi:coxsackievirus and adenovirus receptor homolog isoform X2 [Dicentrarchus labrax]|uniref:coxsackievirus and adenovirus receptor homolog isoform X2 n=1 Tax=Dicentrarchus labrax TaxID=13489 RepID=UPI0021F5CB2B|nr:coxsackievirus and adenovirus receptor homolog isoform X2 [Dicentrarchus labrax]
MKSILLVLLSSVALNFTGNCDVIGSTQTVKVKVNDVAILPCFSTSNMTNAIVKWKQEQSNKKYVHFYRSGDDNVDDQDENFRGRTSLSRKEMSGGNVSLKLTNVTELDAGNYTCDARVETSPETVQHRKCNVTLIVEPEKDPVDRKQVRVPGTTQKRDHGTTVGICVIIFIIVILAIILLAAVFFIWRKCKNTILGLLSQLLPSSSSSDSDTNCTRKKQKRRRRNRQRNNKKKNLDTSLHMGSTSDTST